jgi:hypothetical protein
VSPLPGTILPGFAFVAATNPRRSRSALVAMLGLLTVAAAGCVADGYVYSGSYDYGADYYYPSTILYGGWGPNYYVGPYRRGYFGGGRLVRPESAAAFRRPPASRPMPSMPSRPHGGGGPHGGRP